MTDAYIYDAVRTPRGKGRKDGSLHEVTPVRLAVTALQAIRDRNKLDTHLVDDVVLGCVMPIGEQGADIARTAAVMAGFAESVSGVQGQPLLRLGPRSHQHGGSASHGRPEPGRDRRRRREHEPRADGQRRRAPGRPDPAVAIPMYFVPQGVSADLIATKYGLSRDDVDAYAVESQKRAKAAWDAGYFKKSIVPVKDQNGVELLNHDELMRPPDHHADAGGTRAQLQDAGRDDAGLRCRRPASAIPRSRRSPTSTMPAIRPASSTVRPRSCSAPRSSARRPASSRAPGSAPLPRSARSRRSCSRGPAPASEKALKRAGMSVKDIDLFELNEAFAAVVLRYMQVLKMPHDKIQRERRRHRHGHPLGAHGAMILGTLLDELERRGCRPASPRCASAAAWGTATIIERV